jgi:hypothetical protein
VEGDALAHEFKEFLTEGAESGAWLRLNPPRPLSDEEQALIRAHLAHEFQGRDQLRRQLPSARVVAEAVEGDPSFKMSPHATQASWPPLSPACQWKRWGGTLPGMT